MDVEEIKEVLNNLTTGELEDIYDYVNTLILAKETDGA